YETGEYKNTPYLITELTKGNSLSALLDKVRFSVEESVELIKQLLEALNYVHGKGVIHRDIKPANIIIDKEKNKHKVKLLDFGLSHIMELSQIKGKEEVVGTFGYMSPEATGIVKKAIDERSDLYSLGIVFYNLLTGELPFKSKDTGALLHQQVAVEPSAPRKVKSTIPHKLEEIVLKLLYKDPELRYQSARGLLYDIQRYKKGEKDFIIGEQDQKVKLTYQTRLVGREEEIEKIKRLFNKAREGEGSICLIGGDPGVGKTRLVEAIQQYAYEQGYKEGGLFIRGKCLNQENKIPYQPFRDALNEYVKKAGNLDQKEKDKERKRLNKILGDLGDIILRLNPNIKEVLGEVPDLIPLDPERESQRFLMVVAKFLSNLTTKDRACIIFLDDLQWADEGSLRLLEEISLGIKKNNLFILGTYRNNEVDEDHSLTKIIDPALEKKHNLVNIILSALNFKRLNKMVSGILGENEEKSVKLAEYILEKSGGNPFFAITILRELVEQKTMEWKAGCWVENWAKIKKVQISSNIVDMIIARLVDIPERIDEILQIGALIGKSFEMYILYHLIEADQEEVISCIDEAIERQLLERSVEKKGKVVFIHDRIKEAFLAKISKSKMKEYHLRIASVIEKENKGKEEDVIFMLAHHFREGGDPDKTLEYSVPAARMAKINYANYEAIKYYKNSIEILDRKKE
ncbi:MAG: AAA family ATPase, partial [Spirochaetes bacterium]|nr:AAA family ATPase [Spirochaetota bacterium]